MESHMASMDNVGRDCRDFSRERLLKVGHVECAVGPGDDPYNLLEIHIQFQMRLLELLQKVV